MKHSSITQEVLSREANEEQGWRDDIRPCQSVRETRTSFIYPLVKTQVAKENVGKWLKKMLERREKKREN